MPLTDTAKFLRCFLRRPGVIGAVAPSSPALARAMVEWIHWDEVRATVEYGPGTGAFTQSILSQKPEGARYFGIEIEAALIATLRRKFPQAEFFQESVANVRKICDEAGVQEVDAILSGLPWAAFEADQQKTFLDAALSVLRADGQFVTFAYLQGLLIPAGRRFRQLLKARFTTVETSPVVWRNLPPAFVYRCRK